MADTEEVQTVEVATEDTSQEVSEAVETTETTDDVELEDIEVSEDELYDTEDSKEEAKGDDTPAELEETEVEESSEEEDTTSEQVSEEPQEGADEKKLAHEAFKRREAERKLREERNEREQDNLNRYLQEADDDEVELAKRQLEVQQYQLYKQQSAFNEQQLELGIQRAANSIDLLKDTRPEIQEEFAKALDDFERMYVVKDKQGNPLEVKADVYQYLQDKADSIRRLQGVGERKAGADLKKAKAVTIKPPSRTPKESKQDSDLADFDSAW